MTDAPGPHAPSASDTIHDDASLGQRVGGLLLDLLLVILPVYVVGALLFGESEAGGGSFQFSLSGVPFLLVTALLLAYYVVAELTAGQTLGKLIVGTRVVADRGGAPGLGAVVLRNLLRAVDGFPFYAIGFFVALASKKNQRLGDMAGSTRVVRTR